MRTYDPWFPRYALRNTLVLVCKLFLLALGQGSSALSIWLNKWLNTFIPALLTQTLTRNLKKYSEQWRGLRIATLDWRYSQVPMQVSILLTFTFSRESSEHLNIPFAILFGMPQSQSARPQTFIGTCEQLKGMGDNSLADSSTSYAESSSSEM